MPLKLRLPGRKHPTYRVFGTYLGVNVDRSTGARDRKIAKQILAKWKDDIERGAYARAEDPTFASAALSYMQAGGERTFLRPIIEHFGNRLLQKIKQSDVDKAAVSLYPNATPATRNRQVYTPVSAVLRHADIAIVLKRPRGAGGTPRTCWLNKEQAFALLASAWALEPRFGLLCEFLLYTGCRLGEALGLQRQDLDLPRSFAYIGKTKNGEPQPIHLPPQVVAELANLDGVPRPVPSVSPLLPSHDKFRTLFPYTKGSHLYGLLARAANASGVRIPERVGFHILRHSHATWRRIYADQDTTDLQATGLWKSRQAAAVYEHVDTREAARKADLLPTWRVK